MTLKNFVFPPTPETYLLLSKHVGDDRGRTTWTTRGHLHDHGEDYSGALADQVSGEGAGVGEGSSGSGSQEWAGHLKRLFAEDRFEFFCFVLFSQAVGSREDKLCLGLKSLIESTSRESWGGLPSLAQRWLTRCNIAC